MLFLEGIPMRESLVIITIRGVGKGATAIIEFFSVTHTSKKSKGPGAPVFVEGAACATAQWHNGQSKPGDFKAFRHGYYLPIVLHVPLTMQHLKLPLELIEVQRITLFSPPQSKSLYHHIRRSSFAILPRHRSLLNI